MADSEFPVHLAPYNSLPSVGQGARQSPVITSSSSCSTYVSSRSHHTPCMGASHHQRSRTQAQTRSQSPSLYFHPSGRSRQSPQPSPNQQSLPLTLRFGQGTGWATCSTSGFWQASLHRACIGPVGRQVLVLLPV